MKSHKRMSPTRKHAGIERAIHVLLLSIHIECVDAGGHLDLGDRVVVIADDVLTLRLHLGRIDCRS